MPAAAAMRDRSRPLAWNRAALALEVRLRELAGQVPERVDPLELRRLYPIREWIAAAWRVTLPFSDGVDRRFDVVISQHFPVTPVRTILVDHPPPMTWPHVEHDGMLCLLPNLAEVDPDDPAAVAETLLRRSVRLVEELLEGKIVERDFKEEFLTYWAYRLTGPRPVISLVTPAPPSRPVRIWTGKDFDVVGEDEASLARWLRKRFGPACKTKCEPAVMAWLETPPLPVDYPETGAALRDWLARDAPEAAALLDAQVAARPDRQHIIIGAEGRGGPGLIAVAVPNPKSWRSRSRPVSEPVTQGYRPEAAPAPMVSARFLGGMPAERHAVNRADPAWIHGRGRDLRSETLLGRKVVLCGCGSVGAPIALLLAQAGVGHLILVDPQDLTFANVGRHPLGASDVGCNKAIALSDRLQRDFPHLRIDAYAGEAQFLLDDEDLALGEADLVIAATGSWAADSAINHWQLRQGRTIPVLYGWTEAHACAGHAVVIGAAGGCLQCGLDRTGKPDFRIVDWPKGGDGAQEEPACGAHYQPYGPVELGHVTAMIADAALAALLEPAPLSAHKMLAAPESRVAALGGVWSEAWHPFQADRLDQLVTAQRDWPASVCRACAAAADAEEAA